MPPPSLQQLLKTMVDNGASDLHISRDSPPQIRIDGALVRLKTDPLTADETKAICYSALTDAQKARFEENQEIDFSFGVKGLARFRGNLFVQKGAVGGAFRMIPFRIRSFTDLGLPPVVAELCRRPRGLVICTGPTGSGKSTTLAAMVDKINSETRQHIMTIEDPIEFVHEHKSCLVNQREVGTDTVDFKKALKYVMRQNPNIVLIGEMRDLDTIEAALTVAETGHLTFGTLHTNNALQTINRIIDVFPAHQQSQIRTQLSFALEGVLSQALVPRIGGGRALALEVLLPTPAIRNLIREDKLHQIYSQMQIGQKTSGMQTLNQSLYNLYLKKAISLEDANTTSSDPEELRMMIQNGGQVATKPASPGGAR